ncbi:sugar phosphate nucleotidyltransferase [Neobacillus mesonae]|uniref:sugar phosphate nucleotidyltransferase n=1 Tax=Neobacillus mesonae TaxID=1193713 RepID=UPI00203E09CC|nr:sugar phosphate nucleotidyltransferase [Neobacillus mesonae]MCM3571044.1 sugar phosphate nucleotidyltransferase [Neobacillus mesonae]
MKAVILAGGNGTRLGPITKVINKHLLPVGSYPMIYWPLIKLKKAGLTEILIVTNKEDLASFIKLLGTGKELGVNITYRIQEDQGSGIANAINCARDFVDNQFIVLLGDNLFSDHLHPYIEEFIKGSHKAMVLLKEVADPKRYGVAELDEANQSIQAIIEKPENPPSKYCVTGIYFYNKHVFELIDLLKPSSRGELEITDLNNLYIYHEELHYEILKDWWLDAGTHDALFEANKYFYKKSIDPEVK